MQEEATIGKVEETPAVDSHVAPPVTTVTSEDAVTTNADNVVVAVIHSKYRRFERLEHVPSGCRTYTSKAELMGQTKKQLENVYSLLKGCELKSFKDHDTAVENVWHAFGQLPVFDPVKDDPGPQEKKKPAGKNGKAPETATADDKKKSYQKKREENKYVIKAETEKSKKMVGELAPQAQCCVEIIRKDGKAEYLESELKALMEANKEKLRTRQTAWRIFQYYRSNLISADVLVQQ